jgi:hypothetical protein
MRGSGKIHPVQRLVELLRKVVSRHVRALSKKKWSSGIDIRTLSGKEWLRLLTGETNMVSSGGVGIAESGSVTKKRVLGVAKR